MYVCIKSYLTLSLITFTFITASGDGEQQLQQLAFCEQTLFKWCNNKASSMHISVHKSY